MSVELNGRTMGMLVAATLALGGTGTAVYVNAPSKPKAEFVRKPVYQPRIADQRSWGGLGGDELAAFNAALKALKPSKVSVFCNGNFCRDLAEDLDEAFESAGFDSYLETSVFDTGKGIGISPSNERTRAIASALSTATHGRVALQVFDPTSSDGKPLPSVGDDVVIAIARKKPNL